MKITPTNKDFKKKEASLNQSDLDDFLLNNNSPFGSIGANNNNTEYINSKDPTPKDREFERSSIKNINKSIQENEKSREIQNESIDLTQKNLTRNDSRLK